MSIRTPWRLPAALLLGLLLLGTTTTSSAKPKRPAVPATPADGAKLAAAEEALRSGQLDDAKREFEAIYKSSQSPEALLGLGRWAEKAGQPVAAADLYRRYLGSATTPVAPPLLAELQQTIAALKVPTVEAGVVGERGWLLYLDGRLIGALPLPDSMLLEPGAHRFLIERAGKRAETAPIDLPADRQLAVSLTLSRRRELIAVVSLLPAVALLTSDPAIETARSEAVRRGLESSRAVLIRSERLLEIRRLPEFASCQSALALSCQEQLGARLHATYVLTLQSAPSDGGKAAALSMQLFDVRTGQLAHEQTLGAPADDAAQNQQLTTALREALLAALSRPRATLEVTSTPPGAQVRIGDRRRGPTPFASELFADAYEVVVEQTGFVPSRRAVQLTAGETSKLDLRLTPNEEPVVAEPPPQPLTAPPPPPLPPHRPRWRLATGLALLGVGAILVGFGASALAANGQCKNPPDPTSSTPCAPVYLTAGVGGGLLGGGGALLIGGGLLLAWPPR